MKTTISDTDIYKLAEGARQSMYYAYAAQLVSRRFKSMHYLSSRLICDCIVLNNVLNSIVTPTSANEIIVCLHRKNKSFHTTVNSAFYPIRDKFEEYAKTVLGGEYETLRALNLRNTEYIVYVLSLDLSANKKLDSREVYMCSYKYSELIDRDLPHY